MSKSEEDYAKRFERITGRKMNQTEIDEYNKNRHEIFDKYVEEKYKPTETLKPTESIDPLEAVKIADAQRETKKFEEESKIDKEAAERKAKTRELETQREKDIAAWTQQFIGELPRHREIRQRLYQLNTMGNSKAVQEEQQKLRIEYDQLHYQYPNELATFKQKLVYESERLGLRLVSVDGKRWIIQGIEPSSMLNYKALPIAKVDESTKSGTLTIVISNAGIYDFKRSNQLGDIPIKLEDIGTEPKIAVVPAQKKEVKIFNCEDIDQEHKFFNNKCMVCGQEKTKEK